MVRELESPGNYILSKKAIVFKDKVWNIESGAGCKLKLKEIVGEKDEIEDSSRVRYSDQMMMSIRGQSNLKIAIMNEPSTRSYNPLGYRRCFGLPRVERVINILSDLYLV